MPDNDADAVPVAPADAAASLSLTLDPWFSGDSSTDCSAERYLRNIETLRGVNNWSDQRTIAHAMRYLKGAAEAHFLYSLPASDKDRIMSTWQDWAKEFKTFFFTVANTGDVSTEWTKLLQLPAEPATTFYARIRKHVSDFVSFFPPLPARTHAAYITPTHAVDLTTLTTFSAANLAGDAAAEARGELVRVVSAIAQEHAHGFAASVREMMMTQIMDTLSRKIFISGLRTPEHKEAARSLEMKDKDNRDILLTISQKEKAAMSKPLHNAPLPSFPTPQLGKIASVSHSGQAGRGGGSARGQSRGSGRGGGRRGAGTGSGGRGARTQYPRDPSNYTPNAECSYCSGKHHVASQCFKLRNDRERMAKADNSTVAAAEAQAPPAQAVLQPSPWEAAAIGSLPFSALPGNV